MASARERVLGTTELLEAILLEVDDLKVLLLAQLVSQRFHGTITSSPALQQKLFLRPDPNKDPKQWTVNPLLRKHFLPWFLVMEGGTCHKSVRCLKLLELAGQAPERTKGAAFHRADSSWRRMLVVQPPPKELTVVSWTVFATRTIKCEATMSFEDEPFDCVTMGSVYDNTKLADYYGYGNRSGFDLAFENSEAGVQLTLYLTSEYNYERHNTADGSERTAAGAVFSEVAQHLDWEETACITGIRRANSSLVGWTSDLTEERGGVKLVGRNMWPRQRYLYNWDG